MKRNILANFTGQAWSAFVTLAFVPVYVRLLGIEAYGLIGFYVMLQSVLIILDLGLSQTLNRELARYSGMPEKARDVRDLVRTLETVYWLVGVLIGVSIVALSPVLAHRWINSDVVNPETVQAAIAMMGAIVALQWPVSLYQGGLMGLQRQVLLNSVRIVSVTIANAGAALVLWFVSPTITAFFTWHIVIATLQVAISAVLLWRCLPRVAVRPSFNWPLIKGIWRFAAGMSGIALSAMILTQLDKVILSKLLSLKMFGYYTLAGTVANGLYLFISPIFHAIFPRLSSLVETKSEGKIRDLYHQGTQLMAVLVLPAAAVLSLFSFEVVLLWTGNAQTAEQAAPIISILVLGTALNGLMNLPYALQLSHGWTSIGLRVNVLLIIILAPAIFFLTTHFGPVGAAVAWALLNLLYMLIAVPLTHRRLLPGDARRWFVADVIPPLLAASAVVVAGRMVLDSQASAWALLLGILLVSTAAMSAALFVAPEIRAPLLFRLQKALAVRSPS